MTTEAYSKTTLTDYLLEQMTSLAMGVDHVCSTRHEFLHQIQSGKELITNTHIDNIATIALGDKPCLTVLYYNIQGPE